MRKGISWLGLGALVVGASLISTSALATCRTDCRALFRSDYRTCRTGCGTDRICRHACRDRKKADVVACKAAASPVPPECGRATTNATTTTTTIIRTGGFTCTEVLGFSQTGMWYLDVANGGGGTFEPLVGDGFWQLRADAGAGVSWQDPTFAGWTSTPYSPCAQSSSNPDRVLLTISTPSGVPTLDWWVTSIRAEIATIRTKYSNLREIVLQPVVGGPTDGVCNFGGNPADPVHASVIHPTIDQAIAQVVGGDVIAGMSPEVRTCADYADNTGHLQANARPAIGTLIGQFYAAF